MIWTLLFAALMLRASADAYNVALGKPAVLDSVYEAYDWNAGLAVDGDTNSDAHQGSCAHNKATDTSIQAYWQVDLLGGYNITSITVYNRFDCCNARMGNTRVIVSDTDAFEDGTLCTTIMTGAPSVTLQCDTPIVGRYVTLQRNAAGHESYIINICEVEIEGEPVNLALGKPAVLDSVYEVYDWNAGLAVDGNANSDAHDGFCAHNDGVETAGIQAYWQVDLQASYQISSLTIANRQDCCGNRLPYTHVYVSDTDAFEDGTECAYIELDGHQAVLNLQCDVPVTGRYVTLQRDLDGHQPSIINICEVEVYSA